MLDALIKATIGISAILCGWLAVQMAWRYLTGASADTDALAGRLGCRNCACKLPCENEGAGGDDANAGKQKQAANTN